MSAHFEPGRLPYPSVPLPPGRSRDGDTGAFTRSSRIPSAGREEPATSSGEAAVPAPEPSLTVEDRPPDAATILARLRLQHPRWAILHQTCSGAWVAVRGKTQTVRADDPITLADSIAAFKDDRSR
jgi:hypothetical protein